MIEFAPKSEIKMTYEEALLYCSFLAYNDHRDWRLPTAEEYSENNMRLSWHDDWRIFRGTLLVTPVRDV